MISEKYEKLLRCVHDTHCNLTFNTQLKKCIGLFPNFHSRLLIKKTQKNSLENYSQILINKLNDWTNPFQLIYEISFISIQIGINYLKKKNRRRRRKRRRNDRKIYNLNIFHFDFYQVVRTLWNTVWCVIDDIFYLIIWWWPIPDSTKPSKSTHVCMCVSITIYSVCV